MNISLDLLNKHLAEPACLAFSGGSDSMVLLDLVYKHTDHRPPVIFTDSGMEYPGTFPFVRQVCRDYGAELHVAEAPIPYLDQWRKYCWPMLGKLAARKWMQKHPDFGYRLDVTGCCRRLKIAPARKLARSLGCKVQLTGQRGNIDDALRGMRAYKDGAAKYVKEDDLTICNALTGWTDTMVRRYTLTNRLPVHPAKRSGAVTIGCLYCGGGAQFTNSGFRVLRQVLPDAWRKFIVDDLAGEIILSIKHDQPLDAVRSAIAELGGLANLADTRPWLFDFLMKTPLKGYDK